MPDVELTEAFLAKIAGWEAVKLARVLLNGGRVLSSNWTPPLLKGVVQEGSSSYRAGLVIKDSINIENLCTCRQSREWGTICAHVVAVGLHHLNRGMAAQTAIEPQSTIRPKPAPSVPKKSPALRIVSEAEGGSLLELFLILPPNLDQALARGRVMLCLEARTIAGRCPLNAIVTARPYAPSPQDRLLLERIQSLADGELPALLQLGNDQWASLLTLLIGHPRVTLGKSNEVEISQEPWPLALVARLEVDGQLTLSRNDKGHLPPVLSAEGGASWVFIHQRFAPLRLGREWLGVLRAPISIPRVQVPMFLSRDWPALQQLGALAENFRIEDFSLEPMVPRFVLNLAGGLAQLQAQLQAVYGTRVISLGIRSIDPDAWMPDPADVRRYWTRNPSEEQRAVARLLKNGFSGPDDQGRYQLLGQTGVLNFFAREYPRLQREWQVTLEERLERSCANNLERVEPQFAVTPSGVQWFDFSVSYRVGNGESLSPAEVQRLLLSGQNHTRLQSGKFAVFDAEALEEFQETLRDCSPQQQGQSYRVAANQAGFLESTVRQQGWQLQAPVAWQEKVRMQSGESLPECPDLGSLELVLRPYQKQGVAWFGFLRQNEFGGILADEMGLGKTLQTLAFFQSLKAREGRTLPHLIICPTSLVFNWLNEAQKFTPQLKVVDIHGAARAKRFAEIQDADLVVTSYALIRRDADRYRDLEFDTVVLDEAQHIKNRQTQNAQAVKAVRGRHRLVLTGTPLENSVFDLWSIFDFLMPSYLGTAADFRERYELPISKAKDSGAAKRLSRRLRPFLLRRLKRDVAADLPARLEQISFCELSDPQRALYQQVLEAGRREILNTAGEQGQTKGRMVVLTTLLRLRQICCDPRLLPIEAGDTPRPSGKVELFAELLEEVLDGGHRVLVFSQFTAMLSLLREALEKQGVEYVYLDGSTTHRGDVVRQFQDGQAPVFLISLKAGGVGLNLTAADTVIHFDPWWNPAVEDQATDRAHRIGQSRVVTSYKLIARDTVEEKILTLQQRKRELTSQTLGGEESFAESLTWEEIQDLLA